MMLAYLPTYLISVNGTRMYMLYCLRENREKGGNHKQQ